MRRLKLVLGVAALMVAMLVATAAPAAAQTFVSTSGDGFCDGFEDPLLAARVRGDTAVRSEPPPAAGAGARPAAQGDAADELHGEEELAIALVDLDGFMQVNEHHGHNIGDRAIRDADLARPLQPRHAVPDAHRSARALAAVRGMHSNRERRGPSSCGYGRRPAWT